MAEGVKGLRAWRGTRRCDKTDARQACLLGQAHQAQDFAIGHRLISPELNFNLRLLNGDLLQGIGQCRHADGLVIEENFASRCEAEGDGFRCFARLRGLRLGQIEPNGTGQQGGREDKNNQQNQHDIDQRRDIDLAEGLGLRRSGKATKCHGVA